jgi:hypothetical protein
MRSYIGPGDRHNTAGSGGIVAEGSKSGVEGAEAEEETRGEIPVDTRTNEDVNSRALVHIENFEAVASAI